MKKSKQDITGRRSLIAGLGAVTAGIAISATTASAQSGSANFEPARHDVDSWMGEMPGSHRVFIDTSTAVGGTDALGYANNLLNAQKNTYAGQESDFAMVVCYRHISTPFAFNDAMWGKYGEIFHGRMQYADPASGNAPTVNLVNQPDRTDLRNFGKTIDSLGARGVKYVICSSATAGMARRIVATLGGSVEEVLDELVANAVDNSRFVSAGVMAATRAQEYGFSLLYAG
ncbi:MAG: hypothetical protein HOM55_07775 [Proteobacteria bacterium]|jgi:hypothetical protein|nr:hypothetical protein [Pseudomonadota bacterium]